MTLDSFLTLVRARRATRHFKPDAVADDLLRGVLEAARWAPSGYNLQPTHILVVRDANARGRLKAACLGQSQIVEAPIVLVFAGDRRVHAANFERVLARERAAGSLAPEYERLQRVYVPLAFARGPLSLGRLAKSVLGPLVRIVRPMPDFPVADLRYWLAKQAMLAAMNAMLAATAAGLATVPMEGFDAGRVRRVLKIPRHFEVLLVLPLGYAADGPLTKTRLPLDEVVHFDSW